VFRWRPANLQVVGIISGSGADLLWS